MVIFGPQIFSAQNRGGISRSFIELFRIGASRYDWDLVVRSLDNIHLADLIRNDSLAGARVCELPLRLPFLKTPIRIADQHTWALHLKNAALSTVHHTYYRPDPIKGRYNVQTLHDLCDEHFKERRFNVQQRLRSRTKLRALDRADLIVCVSNATKQALEEFRPDLARRSCVIHHGVRQLESWSNHRPIEQPYFLFVGKRGGYKNFTTIARAFQASALPSDFRLVCFGGEPRSKEDTTLLNDLSITNRVLFAGGDDSQLMTYYRHAAAFLYPSLYEGFGLPLLEAMICDCPIIASNATSLPEVGGDVPFYIEPLKVDAWIAALERVASGQVDKALIKAKAEVQLAQFSWEKTAALHNEMYLQF